MLRRQRIQQGYKHLLVENLMSKKMRAENMIKMKADTVRHLTSKTSNIQSHWFETAQSVAKTLQPVTFETHYCEFEAERRRKIKATLEGNTKWIHYILNYFFMVYQKESIVVWTWQNVSVITSILCQSFNLLHSSDVNFDGVVL